MKTKKASSESDAIWRVEILHDLGNCSGPWPPCTIVQYDLGFYSSRAIAKRSARKAVYTLIPDGPPLRWHDREGVSRSFISLPNGAGVVVIVKAHLVRHKVGRFWIDDTGDMVWLDGDVREVDIHEPT